MPRASASIPPAYLAKHGIEPPKQERHSKYNAKPTEYNGVTYASKLEAETAAQLDLLVKAGVVTGWEGQVPFQLHAGIVYVADFVVCYANGGPRTVDTKGVETPVFKLKRKLFEDLYGPLDVIKRAADIPVEGR